VSVRFTMKRLVVCCDGTWNRPDQVNRGVAAPTNVAKFALALADCDADGQTQCLHYEAGVGTRRRERLLGGAFGVGLSRNVRECYRFLVDNYEPGDLLYFLGFSRGAFTARSVAGLVRNCGILRRDHAHRIDNAYALYRSPRRDTEPGGLGATLFRRTYSHPDAPIEFVGVWDTVGALGIPVDVFTPPLLTRLWTFHDTRLSRVVRHAYHAVSIDERRAPFKPTLWVKQDDAPDQVLEQVWFAGVHCDVGGGYPESESGLSKLALEWMLDEAGPKGLRIDAEKRRQVLGGTAPYVPPDPKGAIHESLSGAWKIAEYVPKKHYDYATGQTRWQANRFRRRSVPAHSVIHWSVYERGPAYLATLHLPATVTTFPKPRPVP